MHGVVMNVNNAAENATRQGRKAVERASRHGHRMNRKTACAVARTYLDGVLDDDERVNEALGIALRRLEREKKSKNLR